jgi:hypothetical protein
MMRTTHNRSKEAPAHGSRQSSENPLLAWSPLANIVMARSFFLLLRALFLL